MGKALLRILLQMGLLSPLPTFALAHYVDVNSTNPIAPCTNWTAAANVIQDAVDAAAANDTVLVTNGVDETGGKAICGTMTHRVAMDPIRRMTTLTIEGVSSICIPAHCDYTTAVRISGAYVRASKRLPKYYQPAFCRTVGQVDMITPSLPAQVQHVGCDQREPTLDAPASPPFTSP